MYVFYIRFFLISFLGTNVEATLYAHLPIPQTDLLILLKRMNCKLILPKGPSMKDVRKILPIFYLFPLVRRCPEPTSTPFAGRLASTSI